MVVGVSNRTDGVVAKGGKEFLGHRTVVLRLYS